MSLAARVAQEIASHEVRDVFGIPGSGVSLELIDALAKHDVRFHLAHFEGSAAMMAGTCGRLSGRAGVCLSIKGPGLANALPGLAVCHFEGFPLVAISEAYPPGSPPWVAHKRLDHAALVAAVAKAWGTAPKRGPVFAPLARRAQAEVPGPVLLDLVAGEDGIGNAPHALVEGDPTPTADEPLVPAVTAAERPVVIAGALALRQGWRGRLAELQLPVFTTAAAKGAIDETLPQAAGVYTGAGGKRAPERAILAEADLVVGLGLRAGEVLRAAPFPCRAVNVEALHQPAEEGFAFAARDGLDGAGAALDALATARWGLDLVARSVEGVRRHLLEAPFLPAQAFEAIWRHHGGRVRLVMDTGYFCTVGEHVWRARNPAWCLLAGQGRTMGTGVPMALGAALHDPTVPTVVALGDGGIGMYVAELKLAARHALPVLVVLMSDGAFGSIRTRALRDGLRQESITLDGRSWVPVLEALGIPGARIETLDALEHALGGWDPQGGPAFLELSFDPDAYERMVEEVR